MAIYIPEEDWLRKWGFVPNPGRVEGTRGFAVRDPVWRAQPEFFLRTVPAVVAKGEILRGGPIYASPQIMKAIAQKMTTSRRDFYGSTLAPVGQQRHGIKFCAVDMLMLSVLILEMAALVRLILAK